MIVYAPQLAEAPLLTPVNFTPRANTPLLQAMVTCINNTGVRLGTIPEPDRPSKVLHVVITDGHENASTKKYSKTRVAAMIEHQREVYKWEFLFVGANMDAIAEAGSLGVAAAGAMGYNSGPIGACTLYDNLASSSKRYREAPVGSAAYFDADERLKQSEADKADNN